MAKLIEYDVTGVEESQGGTGEKAKPGVYVAKIVKCVQRTQSKGGSAANDLEVALNVGDEYDWVFTYIGLEQKSDWKLAEFVRALNFKDKGRLDPDKAVGQLIRVKLNHDTYEGEYRPRAGRLMKAQPGDEFGEKASEISSQDGPVDDSRDADGDKIYEDSSFVASREDPDDPDVGSYDAWSEDDLAAECNDRGLKVGGRGNKKDKYIAALRAEDEEVLDVGAGDDEPPSTNYKEGFEPSREDDPSVGSYDDWTEADLLAEVEDRGMTVPGGRGSKKDKLVAALREEDNSVTDSSGSAEPGGDYESWDIEQLTKEWTDRNLGDIPTFRGRGSADRQMAAMVEEIRKDDIENPFSN